MAESGVEPNLRTYLAVLRRRKWWVASLAILGLVVSLAFSLTEQKQYSATAQLLVQSVGSNLALNSGAQSPVTATDVQTELQLVTSAQVQKSVRKALGSVPPVSAAEVGQTNLIAVTATDASPARAAVVANAYARGFVASNTASAISNVTAAEDQLSSQIDSINKEISHLSADQSSQLGALSNQEAILKGQLAQLQVAGAEASSGLEFVTPAQPPTVPSSPRPTQDGLLGLAIGLLIGLGAAFLRDSLDDTLTSSETAERVSDAPVLATIPLISSWRKGERPQVLAVSEPTSQAAEAYRSLRTSLQFARQAEELRTLLVTSPREGEGKTATVANLGAAFAQAGERVVVVSCDLRRPRLGQFFPADGPSDLVAVLHGEQSLDDALKPAAECEGLWTLGAQSTSPNPTELLSAKRVSDLIAELERKFDLVIVDSPPVLPVADAMILTAYADAVLVLAAASQTRRGELRRTAEKLAQANARVIGLVLNKVSAQSGYEGYGHPYGYPSKAPATGGARHASNQNGYPPLSLGRHDRSQ
jgi:succinoglycan biosynthesis transport protein ExoP